jgi:hypothetical protein
MLLSKRGLVLASAPTVCLAGIGIFELTERKRRAVANARAYLRLSTPNKQVVDAILEKQRTTKLTLPTVAAAYKDQTGQTLKEDELWQKLSEIEKTGIVMKGITNFFDEPIYTWKIRMVHR